MERSSPSNVCHLSKDKRFWEEGMVDSISLSLLSLPSGKVNVIETDSMIHPKISFQ
jgi:hypothetical protein